MAKRKGSGRTPRTIQHEQITLSGFDTPAEPLAPENKTNQILATLLADMDTALISYAAAGDTRQDLQYWIASTQERASTLIHLMNTDSPPRARAAACLSMSYASTMVYHLSSDDVFHQTREKFRALALEIGKGEKPLEGAEVTEVRITADGRVFILPEDLEEYALENPEDAAAYSHSVPSKVERTMARASAVSLAMDVLKDPEDAFANRAALMDNKYFEQYLTAHHNRLIQEVAKQTGADPQQIADKNTRTEEQQRALVEAAGREKVARLDAFMSSNYTQALNALADNHAMESYEDRAYTVKEFSVLYFFALHDELKPTAAASLSAELLNEVQQIYGRMAKHFISADKTEPELELFKTFIETDSPDAVEVIAEKIPRVFSKVPQSIDYPLDKINSLVWDLLEIAPEGQIGIATERRGSGKEATILYSINFDALETDLTITKKLTTFDKRCYIAVSALYNSKNEFITASQIHKAMGNTSNPSAADVVKINESLTKMGAARVYIDNTQEVTVNKKYPRFKYDAPLLPFERCSAYINSQLTESAIHLFREPPLTTFAKERKQITTISQRLLASPVSKTEANLRLDDYLIERIAHIKRGKASAKLLYSTIFERCGIADKKSKQRTPDKIRRYLEHYKQCEYIKGYTEGKDGIIIKC